MWLCESKIRREPVLWILENWRIQLKNDCAGTWDCKNVDLLYTSTVVEYIVSINLLQVFVPKSIPTNSKRGHTQHADVSELYLITCANNRFWSNFGFEQIKYCNQKSTNDYIQCPAIFPSKLQVKVENRTQLLFCSIQGVEYRRSYCTPYKLTLQGVSKWM